MVLKNMEPTKGFTNSNELYIVFDSLLVFGIERLISTYKSLDYKNQMQIFNFYIFYHEKKIFFYF